jgi:RNA-directed DNA polymerase
MKPILSVRDLSSRLGVPLDRLRVVAKNVRLHYRPLPLIDKDNPQIVRELTVPDLELKNIQRRIKSNILSRLPLSQDVHGGVQGRSQRSNAEQHLGRDCVVNLDVKKYFPHVRHYMVNRMFRHEFGFGRDVSSLLTSLTTLNSELPQGAPTSTAIANLFLAQAVDTPMSDRAAATGHRYSRFVDDIALSGPNPQVLIHEVARMLSSRRLQTYRKKAEWPSKPKMQISSNARRQEVTGLVVNSQAGPSVSRQRRDKIRAEIFALSKGKPKAPTVASIRGKIAYVRQFNPGSASRLERLLKQGG